jgi:hypothetical protein
LAHRNAGRVVQSRPEIPSTYRGLVDPSRRRGIPNLARCRRAPSVRVDTLLLPASRYQPCSPPFHLSPACSRDSNWTHMHELPDLRPGALCYSHRVTRELRAIAPARPRFERAPSPLLSLRIPQPGDSGVSLYRSQFAGEVFERIEARKNKSRSFSVRRPSRGSGTKRRASRLFAPFRCQGRQDDKLKPRRPKEK